MNILPSQPALNPIKICRMTLVTPTFSKTILETETIGT